MLELPAWTRLKAANRVLIAGAGGGFDVFSGLPLALALHEAGKQVHLANLSFSRLDAPGTTWIHDHVAVVDTSTPLAPYLPERHLADWLSARSDLAPRVFAFRKSSGVVPLREAYRFLVDHLDVDAIVLVDGGTDSLMRGDEVGLGTPVEDMASIAAAADLEGVDRMLVALGFGIDAFHGVCHAHVLRAIAELSRVGGYLGAHSLLHEMPEVDRYLDALRYVQERNVQPSIVSASIADALLGRFGDHHSTARTAGSTLFINPLMGLYWFFDLPRVAQRVLYLDALAETETWGDVRHAISAWRAARQDFREWELLPM